MPFLLRRSYRQRGEMTALAIITILAACGLILLARIYLKGINPASFFTIFWSLQICVILIGWSDFLFFKYSGIIYILVAIVCFDVGYLVAYQPGKVIWAERPVMGYNRKWGAKVYFFVLALAFLGILYNLYLNGFRMSSISSVDALLETSNENSINRYSGDVKRNIITQLLDVNGYACPMLAGLFYHYYQDKRKLFSFLGLLPCILDGLVQGAKMGIITGAIMWLIGYVISSELLSRKMRIKFKHILFFIGGVLVLIVLLFVTMLFRYGALDANTSSIVVGKITSYSLGHLPAFDLWFDSIRGRLDSYTFGARTFNGITNPLGILKRSGGVFESPTTISPYGDSTNVYTVYRFFIEDFGVIGSLLYIFCMGGICRVIRHGFRVKHDVFFCVAALSMMYFFISWSFVASIFAYTTYIALFLYLYMLVRLCFKKCSRRKLVQTRKYLFLGYLRNLDYAESF